MSNVPPDRRKLKIAITNFDFRMESSNPVNAEKLLLVQIFHDNQIQFLPLLPAKQHPSSAQSTVFNF